MIVVFLFLFLLLFSSVDKRQMKQNKLKLCEKADGRGTVLAYYILEYGKSSVLASINYFLEYIISSIATLF